MAEKLEDGRCLVGVDWPLALWDSVRNRLWLDDDGFLGIWAEDGLADEEDGRSNALGASSWSFRLGWKVWFAGFSHQYIWARYYSMH